MLGSLALEQFVVSEGLNSESGCATVYLCVLFGRWFYVPAPRWHFLICILTMTLRLYVVQWWHQA